MLCSLLLCHGLSSERALGVVVLVHGGRLGVGRFLPVGVICLQRIIKALIGGHRALDGGLRLQAGGNHRLDPLSLLLGGLSDLAQLLARART